MTFSSPAIKVLIVDDNQDDASAMLRALRQAGFEPDHTTVSTAAGYVRHLDASLDLILAKYDLPEFNAPTALRLLQAQMLDIPFIVVTNQLEEGHAIAIVKQGATDCMPMDGLARLAAVVAHALDARILRDEQRKAQAALQASETRFRALIERAADGVLMFALDTTILYASPASTNITGLSTEELVGQNGMAFLHPEDADRGAAIIGGIVTRPGESGSTQLRIRHKNGSWCWVEAVVTNLLEDPRIEALVINFRDITERMQIEEAEREQRQFAEAMRDTLAALTASLDLDTVMERILNYASEVVTCDASSIILFEDINGRSIYLRNIEPAAEAQIKLQDWRAQLAMEWKERDRRQARLVEDTTKEPTWIHLDATAWVRSHIGIPIEHQGNMIGLLSLDSAQPHHFQQADAEKVEAFARYAGLALENAFRIAGLEKKVAERTVDLERTKNRLEAIVNNSVDAIVLIDSDSVISQVNRAFGELFACQPDRCFGQSLLAYVDPIDVERVKDVIQALSAGGRSQRIELNALRADASHFHAELSCGHVRASTGIADRLVCTIRDITEQKRAELALKRSADEEREFKRNLQELHDITVILTPIDDLNEFYRRSLELGRERLGIDRLALFLYDSERGEAVGTYGTDLNGNLTDEHGYRFVPDAGGMMARAFEGAQRGGAERFRYDDNVMLYDHNRSIEIRGWNAAAVLWDGSRSLGWFVADNGIRHRPIPKLFPDILALYGMTVGTLMSRKQALAALVKSEANLRTVMNSTSVGIVLVDRNGTVRLANQLAQEYATRVYGFPLELDETRVTEIELPGLSSPDSLQRALAGQQVADEYSGQFQSRPFTLDIRYDPVLTRDGDVIGTAVSFIDITRRKQAEKALRESEASLATAQRIARIGSWEVDLNDSDSLDHLPHRWSGELYRILGYRPGETSVSFDSFYRVIHPDDLEKFKTALADLLATGKEFSLDHRVVLADDHERVLHQQATIIYDEKTGSPLKMVGAAHDITERKRAEDALRKAFDAEKDLSDLKSRFVSTASHEFRTPLASILSSTDLLAHHRKRMDEFQVDEKLDTISDQVMHLTEIIDSLLDLARIESGQLAYSPVETDLDGFCRKIVGEFANRPDVLQDIAYTCEDAPLCAMLDRRLMHQCVSNLISNAVKYSPPDTQVFVTLAREGDDAVLRVRDQGIGIPEPDLARLYEPFHRASNVGAMPGTGLGLSVTKEAIGLHGGSIKVESEVGTGTTVTLALPLMVPDADAP